MSQLPPDPPADSGASGAAGPPSQEPHLGAQGAEPTSASEPVAPGGAGAAAPAATGMSTATKVIAVVVVAALLLGGAALFWWFRYKKAHDLYSAASATAEAQSVTMTAHLEMDDKTLRELMSGQDVLVTSRDVSSVGLQVSKQSTEQQSTVPWLPAGSWSYSMTYEGQPAATLGVTEATGSQVLAALIDPELINTALAQLTRSNELTVESMAADALDSAEDASPWKPYLQDLLDGKSVGVNLGEGSYIATTAEEAMSSASGTENTDAQALLQDIWTRIPDELPSAVTTTELGEDEFGTQYSVVVDIPKLISLVADSIRQSCDEQEGLDDTQRASCREAADEMSQSANESGLPPQFEFLVWTQDGKVSRVVIDVAKAILKAAGPDTISAEAVIRVVMDMAYDQPAFDFTDLVVIPDDVLRENVEESTPTFAGAAAGLP